MGSKQHRIGWTKFALAAVTTAVVGAPLIFTAPPARAAGAIGPQGLTWREIALLPDWSGAWALDAKFFAQVVAASGGPDGNPYIPPLTPKYAAFRHANGAANGGQGPAGGVKTNSVHCLIDGMPGMMSQAYSFEFLFSPGRVTIINDGREIRRIYTDGRSHMKNSDPTFEGESIGHWEGDTLAVDTTALLPQSQMFVGMWDTEQTHVNERIHKIDANTMEDDLTVTDPVIFTTPWSYRRTYRKNPLGMSEYVCEQDNRDANGVVDLTPPP